MVGFPRGYYYLSYRLLVGLSFSAARSLGARDGSSHPRSTRSSAVHQGGCGAAGEPAGCSIIHRPVVVLVAVVELPMFSLRSASLPPRL